MDNVQWESLIELCLIITAWVTMSGGASAVAERVKGFFGLEGRQALALAWTVSAVIAIIGAIGANVINPELFDDPVKLAGAVLSVVVGAGKYYETWKRE